MITILIRISKAIQSVGINTVRSDLLASPNITRLQRLGGFSFVLGLHGLLFATVLAMRLPDKQVKHVPHTVAVMLLSETMAPPKKQISFSTSDQALPVLPVTSSESISGSVSGPSSEITPEPTLVPISEPTPELKHETPPVLNPASPKVERIKAAPLLPVVTQERIVAPRQKPVMQHSGTQREPQPTVAQIAATQPTATQPTAFTAATLEPTIKCSPPDYPNISRRRHEQGQVTLRFLIGKEGHVLQTQIANTSGYSRLDEAAREALSKCQFRSAVKGGQAVQSWAVINYLWRLQ